MPASVVIAGGGPAGLMAGFLLARAGVSVTVLEKHGDFLRDFRGDTIHPSTLQIMHELGLLAEFLTLPYQKTSTLSVWFGDEHLSVADFRHLPTACGFVAMMPQWDFLNFLAGHARRLANFRLLMDAEAAGLIEESGRVVGVRTMAQGEFRADLVIAADGRDSVLREAAGLVVEDFGAPMDVFWFRLPRAPTDPQESFGRMAAGQIFVMIDRGTHWQCANVIAKGSAAAMRARGLEAFRAGIARMIPFLADRTDAVRDWDDVKLLTVQVNRLKQWWRPGLLCIGDAAHAMSPIGGVGVNLAVQDAVATANILAGPLRAGRLTDADLAAVQKRREFPTRLTQRMQLGLQNRVIGKLLAADKPVRAPLLMRLLNAVPYLRRFPARLMGMGVRPEHVRVGADDR